MYTLGPRRAKNLGFQFCHGWFLFKTPSATQLMYEICSFGPNPRLNTAPLKLDKKIKFSVEITEFFCLSDVREIKVNLETKNMPF